MNQTRFPESRDGNGTNRSRKKPARIGLLTALPVLLAAVILIPMLLSDSTGGDGAITSISQLQESGLILAVSDGAPEERTIRDDFPDAAIQPFTDMVAAYTAVANGKADACVHSRREMAFAMANGFRGVRLLEENYSENIVAVGLSKISPIPDLKGQIDTFLQELRDDGTLDDMFTRWVTNAEETMPDIPSPKTSGGTLRVGTTGTVMPYSYYIGDRLAGYDIELATRFAAWLGMKLEFRVYSFPGAIAAAQAGEVDCIMSNLYYSEEHEEALNFSVPLFLEEVTVMVRATANTARIPFPDSIASSFEKTFLRENRWRLLTKGTGITLLITMLSALLGTALGFAACMLCRNGNPIANTITGFCVRLVHGMPVVVFLMVLYYIVFGRVNISNVAVSVVGFTLIFGSSVFSMLKTAIGALDRKQAEASCALGFSDRQTFFLVLLPQALPHMIQPFSEQVTALIKATSVVGYIAVQDLTKMGDIIRSRTYEAFFPLITVAVIYFLLAWLMTFLVRLLSRRLDPRQRRFKTLLKGVKTHD